MRAPRAELPGTLAVMAAAMLWGSIGTAQGLMPAERVPVVVAALRLAIGALVLLAIALASPAGRAGFRALPWPAVLLAGTAMAGYNLVYFAAVARIGVGIGTALSIGSAPLWVTAYRLLRYRELPSRRMLAGQALCVTGAGLLVGAGAAGGGPVDGYLLALGCGAAYAAYSLATSSAGHAVPSATLAASTFLLAALIAAPALVVLPTEWALAPAAMGLLLAMGLGATGLAYALYTWGLRSVPPATAVTLALIEPLTAWLCGVFVLGEPATAGRLAGAAILFAGLWLVVTHGSRAPRG